MEKRTILAVALSSAILIIYYGFIYKPPKPPVAPTTVTASPAPSPATGQDGPVSKVPAPSAPEAVPAPKVPVEVSSFETKMIKTDLSSKSGFSVHWWLKEFFAKPDKQGGHTDLLIGNETTLPMALLLLPGAPPLFPFYELVEKTDQRVVYRGQWEDLQIEQRLEFGEKDYGLEVSLRVHNQGSASRTLTPGIRLLTQQIQETKKKGFFSFLGPQSDWIHPLYRMGTKVEREQKLDKLGNYQEKMGDVSWAGLEDRYFLRAVVARSVSAQNKVAYGKTGPHIFADLQYGPDTLVPGGDKEYHFTLYLGPKDSTYLDPFAGAELGSAIDFGWFAVVAHPILYAMKWFYSFLGNWGLAIILLTVVIKILLYPLTKKSMASMKAMQKLQPQLKKIREKYQDDRERLNMETMSLFKSHKVNPMGGCLPMLLQMPIYIALYKVLYNSTELYHAPFFWFYRDLSAPDPYFILPILLGISMLAQQKMTPSAGDPAQAKMMMIMPVMFTAFMLFLPVGLVLYIFVNTVMTVIQQYMHQHDITMLGLLKRKKIPS
jgi:YidC/Oxa1 family membrane protein insertase